MGGGDLNLKKSWHPSTLRNIERVWKAEQKHEAEQQKIEQLQKELEDERAREEIQSYAENQGVVKKKDQKLDWMYQGPAAMVNRDEYLLGRKIDKTFETLQQMETGKGPSKDEEKDFGGNMFSSQNLSGGATVDIANKIREDPLFSIMKKEKEERKNLLSNPVKMKQLQKMLEASLGSKKNKKRKKSKKKKHQSSDSEEEMPSKKKHKTSSSDSEESDEKEYSTKKAKKHSKHKKNTERYSSNSKRDFEDESIYSRSSNHSSQRDFNNRYHKEEYSHKLKEKEYIRDDRKNRNGYETAKRNDYDREDEVRYNRKQNSSRQSNSVREDRSYESKTLPSDKHKFRRDRDHSPKPEKKRKPDAAERERLLQEMQANAKWREEQRKRNYDRYKEEEEAEEKATRLHAPNFVKPMLSKAVGKGSLENRVKQKIFTIQRSKGDMDKNFARRH